MSTPVEDFIRQTHKQYNVKYALTSEQLRRIRYKLAQADIREKVASADESLARDIILADYGKGNSTLRTAASTNGTSNNAFSIRSAGSCPRCGQGMTFAKLAESNEVRFCPNCNVCEL